MASCPKLSRSPPHTSTGRRQREPYTSLLTFWASSVESWIVERGGLINFTSSYKDASVRRTFEELFF